MSKERELLNRSRYNLDREYCADLIDEIQELLAQPVKYQFTTRLDQEPVMYQYRDKLDGKDWGRWNLCNKIDYEDYKNNPTFQHWTYQTRKLLAQPTLEPLSDEKILAEIDNNGPFFKYRTFVMGIKFAEKAHGIGGEE